MQSRPADGAGARVPGLVIDGSSLVVGYFCIEGLRLATSPSHFQITTDGFAPYRSAVTTTLGDRRDFAMLIKVYRASQEGEARYSPAEVHPRR